MDIFIFNYSLLYSLSERLIYKLEYIVGREGVLMKNITICPIRGNLTWYPYHMHIALRHL